MKFQIPKSLKILFISNGIFVFASNLLGPLYAVYVEKIDTNILSISFSWFVFMFSATIFTMLIQKYGDHIKEKEYLLIAGFLVRGLAWGLYIITPNLQMLLLIQIVLGLGESLGTPAFNAIFATHLDEGKEVSQYADWSIIQNFILSVGSLIGGAIVYYFSFEALFSIMAFMSLLSSLIVYLQPRKLL